MGTPMDRWSKYRLNTMILDNEQKTKENNSIFIFISIKQSEFDVWSV